MGKTDVSKLENDIRGVVAEIIEVDPKEITLEANFVDDLGMDSMQALEIMAAIEKKYSVQIPEEYLGEITNLSKLLDIAIRIIR